MPSARDVKAGRAYVEVGINDKVAAGLSKVAKKLQAFGATVSKIGIGIGAAGSAITTPFIAAAKIFADMGSEIFDASKRTGIAAESLSTLKVAAEQSGASLGDVETAVRKMSKVLAGVGEDGKSAKDTLADLGVSIEELQGLKPDEQFRLIGERLNGITDASKRAALAQEIYGKSGTQLLPMLDDLAAAEKEARDNGLIITSEDAATADAFGDTLTTVWQQMKMVAFQAGAAVARGLLPFADGAKKILKIAIDWTKQNGKMLVMIAAIGAALVALGATVVVLGAVITSVGVVIGAISAVIGAILSPVALVVVAIIALAAALLKFTPLGTLAKNALISIGKTARETFGGMADALASGRIELAAKIMFAGLKVIWDKGVADLFGVWTQFLGKMGQSLQDDFDFNIAVDEARLEGLRDDAAKLRKEQGRTRSRPGVLGGEAMDAAGKITATAVGIFNGAALRSLQSHPDPALKKVADASEKTAKNTADTVAAIKRMNVGLA